ncbi:MAG: efflux RND transporter periplasmic adaptor subunit [Bacteroidales bacterium]|nr:efflux RND transporter periplasmic adaptor subunit [Bacteroidales bacterium]
MIPRSSKFSRWLMFALGIGIIGIVLTQFAFRDDSKVHGEETASPTGTASQAISVDVVSPRPHGIDRISTQPGAIEPFEIVDLYPKVSGYLVEQSIERTGKKLTQNGKPIRVDIGTSVQVGDILARLAVPEQNNQVTQDEADVARAQARHEQMIAAVATAEAEKRAAAAVVAFAQAELKSKEAYRAFREKQRERIQDLASRGAIDRKLEDEQESQYQAAVSSQLAAGEAVTSAEQKLASAAARVRQAEADVKYALSEVGVAQAKLAKSRTMLDYTIIRSPLTGVISKRNHHIGDFIKSADSGGDRHALLTVERTDLMRVVVQVPERDVPYLNVGDPAIITVDALPGVVFRSTPEEPVVVSRLAHSEDVHTHLMRVEIDLKNKNGQLHRGMFGRVTLELQSGAPGATRIPSAALVGKAEDGKAMVRIVRDDVAQIIPVRYGSDNGAEVEILEGLSPTDRVIIRASGPITNGTVVTTGGPTQ